MRLARRLLPLLWLGALGCSSRAPELLVLADVVPKTIAAGDRLELVGLGFPEGQPATVTLLGELHRPGQRVERAVEVVVRGQSVSANRIEVEVDGPLERELCGAGERSEHTTFRGRLTAAFVPHVAGAPPVSGTLEDVVLDVQPTTSTAERDQQRQQTAREVQDFLGLELHRVSGQLYVTHVRADGPAGAAGLRPGDRLTEANGLLVGEPYDLVGPPGSRSWALRAERAGAPLAFRVDVERWAPLGLAQLGAGGLGVLILGGALVLVLLTRSRWALWLERRLVLRLLEATPPQRGRGWLAALSGIWAMTPGKEGERLPLRLLPGLCFMLASAGFSALALGQVLLAPELDLPLIALVTVTASVVGGLVLWGRRPRGRWSLWWGLKGAGYALLLELPIVTALLGGVLASGSLRLAEIVATQASAPWTWNAFRSPGLLVALLLALGALLPERRLDRLELPEADGDRQRRPTGAGLVRLIEWGRDYVVTGLLTIVLLGGWQAPTLGWVEGPLPLLGLLLLQLKLVTLLAGVWLLRWALPRLRLEHLRKPWLRLVLPSSLAALGVTALGLVPHLRTVLSGAETPLGAVLFGLCALLLLNLLRRVRAALRAPRPPASLNPWL